MRSLFLIFKAVVLGLLLGLSSAYIALKANVEFYTLSAGAWSGSPRTGGIFADPYTKARLVLTGELPAGGGEGVTFRARKDDDGRLLRGSCSYSIEGSVPNAQVWTLTVYGADGRLQDNPAMRYGFSSKELTRDASQNIHVAVSRSVKPGNWLPLSRSGAFSLVLRLYDTPLANAATNTTLILPRIIRSGC